MIRTVHLVVAFAFVAGVILQVFLAGLGVFEDPSMFGVHANWGYALELVVIGSLVLAAVGRLGRRQVAYAAALFGMFMLQSIFVAVREEYPVVAALHPVNGFGILLVGIATARDAWVARAASAASSAASSAGSPSVVPGSAPTPTVAGE
jgi:hypothetical protein